MERMVIVVRKTVVFRPVVAVEELQLTVISAGAVVVSYICKIVFFASCCSNSSLFWGKDLQAFPQVTPVVPVL